MKKLFYFITALILISISFFDFGLTVASTSMAMALSVADIRQFANEKFSSFDGFSGYTGEGDDFIDFGGPNRNFYNATERMFTITIANGVAADSSFYLMPGLAYVPGLIENVTQNNDTKDITVVYPAGIVKTGTFPALTTRNALTGTGSPKSIEAFYAFLQHSPIHVKAMKIQSSASANQLSQFMTIRALSPFKDLQTEIINPDIYLNQNTYNDKKVTFPVDIILSKDVQIEYTVLASNTITITFFCDAVANPTVTLANRVSTARQTFLSRNNINHAQRLNNDIQNAQVIADPQNMQRGLLS
jgi:hypothetical protein